MVAALGTPRTFLRFCLTGLSGVVVNLGSFRILLELGVHKYLASPIAIESSVFSNFIINNYWTFADRDLRHPRADPGFAVSPRLAAGSWGELFDLCSAVGVVAGSQSVVAARVWDRAGDAGQLPPKFLLDVSEKLGDS